MTGREGRIRTAWLSSAAYAGMFGFGIVMALLGAILPLESQRLHFDLAQAGNLFLAMNAAMLVTTLTLGPLLDRFGIKPTLALAPLLVAGALVVIAGAESFEALLASVVLLGVGGGALNQAANTLVADLHEAPRRKGAALNLLGVFFGFGALFVPFTIGSLLEALGLARILYLAVALSLVTTVLSTALAFPPPRQGDGLPLGQVLRLAREPLVLVFAFLLFFESGNEFMLSGYVTSYLTRQLGASVPAASYVLAGYWGSIMLCRVILSRVLLHVRGETLILASALGVAASVALLVAAPSFVLAAVAASLLGFAIAAIFPTTLGLAGDRYAGHSGTVFGILIGVALTGGMTLPWAAGRISESHGVAAGLSMAIVDALAIFVLQFVAGRLMRRKVHA